MDAKRFDTIVRSLTAAGTRRGVLRFLATLPLLVGFVAPEDGAEAAKRRKRGKRSQTAGRDRQVGAEKKRKKKRRKKKCKPKPQATTCAGRCGPVKNNCKKTVDCGSCACDPACEVCFTCDETTRTCEVDPGQVGDSCGACRTCDGSGQCIGCDGGLDCCGDACVDLQSDPDNCGACGEDCEAGQTCQGGVCGVACGGDFCPSATEICDNDACQPCDVCATCDHTTVQDAIDELVTGTVRICAGTYTRAGNGPVVDLLFLDFTLVGAGADSTILDGGEISSLSPVFRLEGSTSTVRQLTVTGANGASGIVTTPPTELTLAGVIVSGNVGSFGAGIFNEGVLTLNAGTVVRGNHAVDIDSEGGGIFNAGEQALLTLNDGTSVTGNTAGLSGGGIFNGAGFVFLNAGSEVSGNNAFGGGAGGIENLVDVDGTVTLQPGSLVCGNATPQCAGFDDPLEICQDTCP